MERYTIMVAGFDHHQKELKPLLTEKNWEYTQTKKEIIEEYDLEDRIYEYESEEYPLHIQAEPDNPYDPNAVKVFAGNTFIGYVPRGKFGDLIHLSQMPNIKTYVEVFGGKYKHLEHDFEEDYLGTFEDRYMKVVTENSPVKAVMVFEW